MKEGLSDISERGNLMTISTKISLFCQALVISEKKIFDVWSNLHNYQNIVKLQFYRKTKKVYQIIHNVATIHNSVYSSTKCRSLGHSNKFLYLD
jgi:hypothetical protein